MRPKLQSPINFSCIHIRQIECIQQHKYSSRCLARDVETVSILTIETNCGVKHNTYLIFVSSTDCQCTSVKCGGTCAGNTQCQCAGKTPAQCCQGKWKFKTHPTCLKLEYVTDCLILDNCQILNKYNIN